MNWFVNDNNNKETEEKIVNNTLLFLTPALGTIIILFIYKYIHLIRNSFMFFIKFCICYYFLILLQTFYTESVIHRIIKIYYELLFNFYWTIITFFYG